MQQQYKHALKKLVNRQETLVAINNYIDAGSLNKNKNNNDQELLLYFLFYILPDKTKQVYHWGWGGSKK